MNTRLMDRGGEPRLDDNHDSRCFDTEGSNSIRPTMDHLVELVCAGIVRCARRGLLPVKAVQR